MFYPPVIYLGVNPNRFSKQSFQLSLSRGVAGEVDGWEVGQLEVPLPHQPRTEGLHRPLHTEDALQTVLSVPSSHHAQRIEGLAEFVHHELRSGETLA